MYFFALYDRLMNGFETGDPVSVKGESYMLQKINIKKKAELLIPAVLLFSALLLGCGEKKDPSAAGTGRESESTDANGGSIESEGLADTDKAGGTIEAMNGEWKFLATIFHSESDGDEYEYSIVCTDPEAPNTRIRIYTEDGRTYMDYRYDQYESSVKMAGMELEYEEGAAYDDPECPSWHVKMPEIFDDEEEDYGYTEIRNISLTEDDRLIVSKEFFSDPDDEYPYHSLSLDIYLRKDSKVFDDPENLAYFDTVTVSNAKDLLKNIGNNKKIILEKGTYDLSSLNGNTLNNKYIEYVYDGYHIKDVYNLCLEAKDGAEVYLSIDDPYSPVVSFYNSRNVAVRGITAGHNVEPGYCSGCVLHFEGVDGVNVDKCNLFGSGTYGIEANYSYDINVTDTDIYECTYGLVSLSNVGTVSFKNCTLRDSSDLSMLYIYGSYDVLFEDCEFKNNRSDAFDSVYFVELGDYDNATFRNCAFINNQYNVFSNKEVTLENCTSDNNHTAFSGWNESSAAPDKDSILADYKEAIQKQEDIESKLGDSLLPQQSLNQLAYEEYELWDNLLNRMWTYLNDDLSESEMNKLLEEERAWLKEKENAMKDAGADFEGGSMQPLVEYSTGATYTRKRVDDLIDRYF